MGLMDKAKDKATEFLNSDEGKQKADEALDTAADKAKEHVGEENADKVDAVRDKVGERLNQGEPEAEDKPE
ncbi:hypothetical protein CATYP_03585 [Corynebacterium atypicum]|uniref:Antitoxin n=1 Tax=Corynebacterium atypicum TaxID=191610 RepID=A0ABN4DBX9_9CORY|nr:Rv0909 family putative TA system antitoxin [Corynebacterium atypicum]AIG63893.1 hypothetical protein CATYP_03585 [Corynebacterium atypicum]